MMPPGSSARAISALVLCSGLLAGSTVSIRAHAQPSYTLFESGQVRPLALSPNGKLLFALNTPDNRLEIFRVKPQGLARWGSVTVGLEPVAIAARSDDEVWVVNHLSDSISVVDVGDPKRARVVRTLLVGDEPRDVVFAGPGRSRAFITTAHRGQNVPYDPEHFTPGVDRADVWVFDSDDLGGSLGGDPLTIITLFTDTPRALAVTPDGGTVHAAGFHTGNRTSSVNEGLVPDGGEDAGGVIGPRTNFEGVVRPETAMIVEFDGTHWKDALGRPWDDQVNFYLPDKDVFVIDAMSDPPARVDGPSGFFAHVGTILFNMIVNPASGKVYVSNTEALNMGMFEGPGIFAGVSLRGHLHESRISVLSSAGVAPRHLNKHIDYDSCCTPAPNPENAKSLAIPTDMAITSDGAKLYVAALGSSKIGVFDTAQLESDTFVPSTANQIAVSGGGPTGLALDEARHRLYVLTRFDDSISVINTVSRAEIAHIPMYNPEPESVVAGRPFLYDAAFSSSHGDSSCASCHVFGDLDSVAWDLGNPDAPVLTNPGPFISFPFPIPSSDLHPMKGPMSTQSLRGMANHGPMHWRGDRTAGNDAPSAQPDSGTFDEVAAFKKFQPAFADLLGRHEEIPDQGMQALSDFILQLTYPPNPNRALDRSLTPEQQIGHDFFFGPISDVVLPCAGCHHTDPQGNPGSSAPGFFGTSGVNTFDFQPQFFKIPHLRNMYQKNGMFGMVASGQFYGGDFVHQGDQIRGFGFLHDGSNETGSSFQFLNNNGFNEAPNNPAGFPVGPAGDPLRRAVGSFLFAFDSNLAPIVGQQITLTEANEAVTAPRIDLMITRADLDECDLVAKARVHKREVGFLYVGGGAFVINRAALPAVPDLLLRQLPQLSGTELTYTCAPPGSGERIGLDRDSDGYLDGDEEDSGSDPADPSSTP